MTTRLAPGLAWPVRKPDLAAALGQASEQAEVSWLSWVKQPSGTPIKVSWLPLRDVLVDRRESHHGLKLWIYPVAEANLEYTRASVESVILPDLARWCRDALSAPEGWQLIRHARRWSIDHGTVVPEDREGVAVLHW